MDQTPPSALDGDTWLSALLTQALTEREEERRALSHILQEEIGQSLAALALHLRLAESACQNPQCSTRIGEARHLVGDVMQVLEQLNRQLLPPALENQGLGPALEILAKDFARTAQLAVELDLEVLPDRPAAALELSLFRIVQDALDNVQQHAYANRVQIVLRTLQVGDIMLVIADDGVGHNADTWTGWGMLRMAQRAEALGGQCEFHGMPGEGARVVVRVPFAGQEVT